MEKKSPERLNWEQVEAYLDDTIKYLEECQEGLEKASCNLKEVEETIVER